MGYVVIADTNLGIKTPERHLISRRPKGCEPRTYCRGTPFPLCLHSHGSLSLGGIAEGFDWICSRIHRNSVKAEGISLQAGRSVAA